MDEIKAKQQVVEKIKEASKILVTVSDSPSVDALSAALGLALVLEKQEKYATAIFSGETPPAIAFLEPEKTFDDTTDSLRDFIIALNKEKADHLRYKVEGDAVKIFITPYKTVIDQSDLEFSQGDYNVELVIALGVDNQDSLDTALDNHGQILHDAAIITVTAGDQTSDLGGVDWHEGGASSLSEMVAGLAEALKTDKKKSLIDETIATALLTGIVAETDRFSNEHTTSKVMTVAANLMAAGADQQLIANELRAAREIEVAPEAPTSNDDADDPDTSSDDTDVEVDKDSSDGSMTIKKDHDPSTLAIEHEGETLADLDRRVRGDKEARSLVVEEVAVAQEKAAQQDAVEEAQRVEKAASKEASALDESTVSTAYGLDETAEPTLGGTLNATTEQAAEDARREAEADQNRTILSHAYLGANDQAPDAADGFPGTPPAAPGSVGVNDVPEAEAAPASDEVHSAYAPQVEAPTVEQPADQSGGIAFGGERVIQPLSEPEQPAYDAPAPEVVPAPAPDQASAPNPGPVDLGLPLPPPLPDFSAVNGAAPALPLPPTQQPELLGDILAPEVPTAPAVDTLNTVAAANSAYAFDPTPAPEQTPVEPQPALQPAPQPTDPGQFQIPTQA